MGEGAWIPRPVGASVNRPPWSILDPASLDELMPVSDGPDRILMLVGSP